MNVPKLIERAGERVLTTAQLAEAYGTDVIAIQQNFHNNKSHYVEGKHFYLLTGDALRRLKRDLENFDVAIPKNVNRYFRAKNESQILPIPRKAPTPEQMEQKLTATLLSKLRHKQAALATAEAELAVQKAKVACERREIADFIMMYPELMPYANLLPMQ